ncbi:nitrilase, putative [Acanthamoeba castellanii str. Neff]|uniref:Nitrilase, putative n=1 Tax=Acanthamoeba castellanii (strain ATCC 30010 / Neff) TaxID=1257118 RepID=L8H9J3_ACACF|nr:nitrilase, putative [Acanthamoeba castellanii str. Neff]ELR21860.1 nitrilase, putative [Acanthamoeba castellanii str. Neff]
MAAAAKRFRFAGLQLLVGADKEANLARARDLIAQAECFNCPYSNDSFPTYAEAVPGGPSAAMLQEAARKHSVYLVGGSIPEREGDKLYNTSVVYDPQGNLIAKHRKVVVHLFDISVPPGEGRPGMTFKYVAMQSLFAQRQWCDVGLGICYDMRFPEMAQVLTKRGVKLLVYPGAFNTTTGPAHWELLQRARAVDNQCRPLAIPDSKYQAWGHSTVVDPWGTIVATTEHDEAITYADIHLDKVDEVRQMIPVSLQKRHDLYEVKEVQ